MIDSLRDPTLRTEDFGGMILYVPFAMGDGD